MWVGFTDEALVARKEFILTSCYNEEFDGTVSFDRIESDVIVDGLGLYHCEGMPHGFRVAKATPTECFGYSQRRAPKGRLRDGYTVDELRRAIDGVFATEFNVERGFTDVSLVCRDGTHVDQYMAAAKPKLKEHSGVEREISVGKVIER